MNKRVSQEKTKEGVLFKIKAYKEDGKQTILSVWMLAWTICGLAIISQVFFEPEPKMKTMLLIFAAFWAYFEWMVIKVFRWRRGGEEQILVAEDKIHFGRTINNRGFLKPYRMDLANQVRKIDAEENAFVKTFGESYWIVSGQRLAFTVGGKVVYFGLRLTDKEASHLMKQINNLMPK